MAIEHQAVCYDTESTNTQYLASLLPSKLDASMTVDQLHDAIDAHLVNNDFAPRAIALISSNAATVDGLFGKLKSNRAKKTRRRAARKERAQKRRTARRQRHADRRADRAARKQQPDPQIVP